MEWFAHGMAIRMGGSALIDEHQLAVFGPQSFGFGEEFRPIAELA
jgi:hypothetical protein